jgi:hypothetical protein
MSGVRSCQSQKADHCQKAQVLTLDLSRHSTKFITINQNSKSGWLKHAAISGFPDRHDRGLRSLPICFFFYEGGGFYLEIDQRTGYKDWKLSTYFYGEFEAGFMKAGELIDEITKICERASLQSP